jgi:hypothetical protein
MRRRQRDIAGTATLEWSAADGVPIIDDAVRNVSARWSC